MDEKKSLNDLYEQGLTQMHEQFGPDSDKYLAPLKDIAPFFERLNVEFPYGCIYTRKDKLDLRVRSLATISGLTVLGHSHAQLKLHIEGALIVGATEQEIIEVIAQMTCYCGFPLATQALMLAKEVFDKVSKKD